jgi:hypothetical protein
MRKPKQVQTSSFCRKAYTHPAVCDNMQHTLSAPLSMLLLPLLLLPLLLLHHRMKKTSTSRVPTATRSSSRPSRRLYASST